MWLDWRNWSRWLLLLQKENRKQSICWNSKWGCGSLLIFPSWCFLGKWDCWCWNEGVQTNGSRGRWEDHRRCLAVFAGGGVVSEVTTVILLRTALLSRCSQPESKMRALLCLRALGVSLSVCYGGPLADLHPSAWTVATPHSPPTQSDVAFTLTVAKVIPAQWGCGYYGDVVSTMTWTDD